MDTARTLCLLLIAGLFFVGCGTSSEQPDETLPAETLPADSSYLEQLGDPEDSDVPYVPTPLNVVAQMLELADVTEKDTVYDLGSGDGRVVIMAAEKYGAHGVGIDIDPVRVKEARENARAAGVSDLVSFREGDLFELDLSGATVVTLYLLPELNKKLRPKLFRELAAGTPIISHAFPMGDWQPERKVNVDGSMLYRWTVPEEKPDFPDQ